MKDFFEALLGAPIPTILLVGGIAFLLLSFSRKIGSSEVDRQPNKWAIVVGTVLLLLGIGSLYLKTVPSSSSNFPFEVKVYNFETVKANSDPWFSVPKSKSYKTEISQESAHSGKHSLRLLVDMQSAATNPDTEYTGIGLVEKNSFQAK